MSWMTIRSLSAYWHIVHATQSNCCSTKFSTSFLQSYRMSPKSQELTLLLQDLRRHTAA